MYKSKLFFHQADKKFTNNLFIQEFFNATTEATKYSGGTDVFGCFETLQHLKDIT